MKIEKNMLVLVSNFLAEVSLNAQASRARTKLNKDINKEIESLSEDQKELIDQYNGEILEGGKIRFTKTEDKISYEKLKYELFLERVTFTETTEGYFEILRKALDNYDGKINGDSAIAYDVIMDSLEG